MSLRAVILLATLASTEASAQRSPLFELPWSSNSVTLMKLILEQQGRGRRGSSSQSPVEAMRTGARSGRPLPRQPIAVSDFTPQNLAPPRLELFFDPAKVLAADRVPLERAMQKAYAEVVVTVEKTVRPNNVAAAFAFTLNLARSVARGSEDYSERETRALMSRFNDAFAAYAGATRGDDGAKQSAHQRLLAVSTLLLVYHERGKVNPRAKQTSQDLARKLLAALDI